VESFEEDARGNRDLLDGGVERFLIRARRLAKAADLTDVLECGLVQLLLRRPAVRLS
jgi:hypothetical protein